MKPKPIIISGTHRSGTTWIGRMVNASSQTRYVHEPFNLTIDRSWSPIRYWYQHLCEKSDRKLQRRAMAYLTSFTRITPSSLYFSLRKAKTLKYIYYCLLDHANKRTHRTIIKDPLMLLSVEWFYQNIDCDVIITIRHPAAFAGSIMAMKWDFDFNQFLKQPDLMGYYLVDFRSTIEKYAQNSPDRITQIGTLWNILNTAIFRLQEEYGDEWYFITHEKLSRNPLEEYRKMYAYLKLPFEESAKHAIMSSSTAVEKKHLERNSIENIKSWKQRLTQDQIARLKEVTESVWRRFYSEEDWN